MFGGVIGLVDEVVGECVGDFVGIELLGGVSWLRSEIFVIIVLFLVLVGVFLVVWRIGIRGFLVVVVVWVVCFVVLWVCMVMMICERIDKLLWRLRGEG